MKVFWRQAPMKGPPLARLISCCVPKRSFKIVPSNNNIDKYKKDNNSNIDNCNNNENNDNSDNDADMSQSQLVWSFESQSRVKVKVVKWCRKKWFDHNLMYIYHK